MDAIVSLFVRVIYHFMCFINYENNDDYVPAFISLIYSMESNAMFRFLLLFHLFAGSHLYFQTKKISITCLRWENMHLSINNNDKPTSPNSLRTNKRSITHSCIQMPMYIRHIISASQRNSQRSLINKNKLRPIALAHPTKIRRN